MLCFVATVAQSVEQLIRNQQVAGSSPASSSKSDRVVFSSVFYFNVLLYHQSDSELCQARIIRTLSKRRYFRALRQILA